MELIDGINALARQFEWVFANPEGQIIPPTTEVIVSAILSSDAFQFVCEPDRYQDQSIRPDYGVE